MISEPKPFRRSSLRRGDKVGAKEQYEAALVLLTDIAKNQNPSLPLDCAEQKRVREGLAKLSGY